MGKFVGKNLGHSSLKDGTPAGAGGSSSSAASGNVTASYGNDLLFCNLNALSAVGTAPSGYTGTYNGTNTGRVVYTELGVGSGTDACTATLSSSAHWTNQLTVFEGAASSPPVTGTVNLNLIPQGTGSGTVVSNLGGINCAWNGSQQTGTCALNVLSGTTVKLTATATAPATFVGYSGGGCGSSPICSLTITQSLAVTAGFTASSTVYTLQNQEPYQVAHYSQYANSVTYAQAAC